VPSNWELHGFGTLHYHRDATNPPPEQGRYEHDFQVPAGWSKDRVFLVFEGVMTDTDARLNGQSVGPVHQGGYYRFKYEVTKLVKFGATNRLEVTVDKHSQNASVNRAERTGDYWMYGGIYRPVYLEAVPQQFIERVAIDARADGDFAMDVFVNGAMKAEEVEAQITTLDGKPVGSQFSVKLDRSGGAPVGGGADGSES
jgi:beta-galactosidase/beta-glucuronidase